MFEEFSSYKFVYILYYDNDYFLVELRLLEDPYAVCTFGISNFTF